MHYAAIEAVHFAPDRVSLAANEQCGLEGADLVYAVVGTSLLVMILLLFSSLSVRNIIVRKVLFVVGVSELIIMLTLPIILPENTPNIVSAILDVRVLTILVFPIAWRVRVNSLGLLDSNALIEKSLEAQQAINQLLYLPLHELSMEVF